MFLYYKVHSCGAFKLTCCHGAASLVPLTPVPRTIPVARLSGAKRGNSGFQHKYLLGAIRKRVVHGFGIGLTRGMVYGTCPARHDQSVWKFLPVFLGDIDEQRKREWLHCVALFWAGLHDIVQSQ